MDVVGYIIRTVINKDDNHLRVIYTYYLHTFLQPNVFYVNFCAKIQMRIIHKFLLLYDREW